MVKKVKAGGYRLGAGRPKGTGKYGELTQAIRIPVSLLPQIEAILSQRENPEILSNNVYPLPSNPYSAIPLYSARVAAGFPVAVDDHIERHLDLNEHLVQRPSSTFFVRVEGESMINAGIHENDILIVDRSLKPIDGKIVIAVVNGELTVKRLSLKANQVCLMPDNTRYNPIKITEEIFGSGVWWCMLFILYN